LPATGRTPWDPAIKDENLRLTLVQQEADYISQKRRSIRKRSWNLLGFWIFLCGCVVAYPIHFAVYVDDYRNDSEPPLSTLFAVVMAIGLLGLIPTLISAILLLVRFLKVRSYRRDFESFLARYNRTPP